MKALIQTKKLSHLALNVLDVEKQVEFYTQLGGLGETARDAAGRVYLRCDGDHHALVLQPAAERGMDHFALELGSEAALAEAAGALDRASSTSAAAVCVSLRSSIPALSVHTPSTVAGMRRNTSAGGRSRQLTPTHQSGEATSA